MLKCQLYDSRPKPIMDLNNKFQNISSDSDSKSSSLNSKVEQESVSFTHYLIVYIAGTVVVVTKSVNGGTWISMANNEKLLILVCVSQSF